MESAWDLEKFYIIWNMVNTGLLSLFGIYTWSVNRQKASNKEIANVKESFSELSEKVVGIEKTLQFVPSKKELDILHKRITELSESQRSVQGEVHHMNNTLKLIHEYLLNHRGSN